MGTTCGKFMKKKNKSKGKTFRWIFKRKTNKVSPLTTVPVSPEYVGEKQNVCKATFASDNQKQSCGQLTCEKLQSENIHPEEIENSNCYSIIKSRLHSKCRYFENGQEIEIIELDGEGYTDADGFSSCAVNMNNLLILPICPTTEQPLATRGLSTCMKELDNDVEQIMFTDSASESTAIKTSARPKAAKGARTPMVVDPMDIADSIIREIPLPGEVMVSEVKNNSIGRLQLTVPGIRTEQQIKLDYWMRRQMGKDDANTEE